MAEEYTSQQSAATGNEGGSTVANASRHWSAGVMVGPLGPWRGWRNANNADAPAGATSYGDHFITVEGFTKREFIATAAMQAIIAGCTARDGQNLPDLDYPNVANEAVTAADALLAQLSAPAPRQPDAAGVNAETAKVPPPPSKFKVEANGWCCSCGWWNVHTNACRKCGASLRDLTESRLPSGPRPPVPRTDGVKTAAVDAELVEAAEMILGFHGGSGISAIEFQRRFGMQPDRIETLEASLDRLKAALAKVTP